MKITVPGLCMGAVLASAVAPLEAQEADIALYDAGRHVSLSQTRSAELRQSAMELFHQCRTWQAVTGTDPSQAELRGLWEDQAREAHVVLRPQRGGLVLRMGVDPQHGITLVLTEQDGLLTSYIKCPGLEAMALGCEFSRELSPAREWPVCAAVERIRGYVHSRAETERNLVMAAVAAFGYDIHPGYRAKSRNRAPVEPRVRDIARIASTIS